MKNSRQCVFAGLVSTISTYLFLAVACSSPHTNAKIPVPSEEMAQHSGKPLDVLGRGYSVFQMHCGECHELIMPKDMRVEEWHSIAPGMAWNAGLKKEDEAAVLAYLMAATKQTQQTE